MGNVFVCLATSASWCFCTALGSLLSSCCGTDKDSTVPPSVASGRKRSVFLLLLSIGIAFFFQYYVGPNVVEYSNRYNVGPLRYMGQAWQGGCDQYNNVQDANSANSANEGDDNASATLSDDLQTACSGQSGVFRAAASTLVFFLLAAITAYCKPTFNREAWVAKYVLFLFLVAGSIFIPNTPVFTPIFVNIFRAGAVLFMVFNQLIILDVCFNLNDSWVEKADRADVEEEMGAGRKWLGALLLFCVILFLVCFVWIGLLYAYFGGCAVNIAFITVTLVMGVLCTVIQLTGEEASLFTSACIFTYATYLLYVAVSKNPNGECNPQLGEDDVTGIILGIGLTLITLLWTGYSSTAHKTVGDESDEKHAEKENDDNKDDKGEVGALAETPDYGTINDRESEEENNVPVTFSTSWKMNIILAAIACWYAMVLTSWGSVVASGTIANPSAGQTSMWMVIASQWLILALYLWTLAAPKLFPDRDFS